MLKRKGTRYVFLQVGLVMLYMTDNRSTAVAMSKRTHINFRHAGVATHLYEVMLDYVTRAEPEWRNLTRIRATADLQTNLRGLGRCSCVFVREINRFTYFNKFLLLVHNSVISLLNYHRT